MIDRNAVIRDAHDLEPLPQSVARLSELLSEPDTDLSSVVECVEFATQVLQIVNRRADKIQVQAAKQSTDQRIVAFEVLEAQSLTGQVTGDPHVFLSNRTADGIGVRAIIPSRNVSKRLADEWLVFAAQGRIHR